MVKNKLEYTAADGDRDKKYANKIWPLLDAIAAGEIEANDFLKLLPPLRTDEVPLPKKAQQTDN